MLDNLFALMRAGAIGEADFPLVASALQSFASAKQKLDKVFVYAFLFETL